MSPKASTALAPRFALSPVTRSRRGLLSDVRQLILQARAGVARAVDSGLVALYWHSVWRMRQFYSDYANPAFLEQAVPERACGLTAEETKIVEETSR